MSKTVYGWFTSSSGRIELKIRRSDALVGSHQGHCDFEISELRKVPYIKKQLDEIDSRELVAELKGYGAWEDKELLDHRANLERVLWLACGEINDERGE